MCEAAIDIFTKKPVEEECEVVDLNTVKQLENMVVLYKGNEFEKQYDESKERFYIVVDGEILYLDNRGKVNNKKTGKSSEVYAFKSIEDVKNIINYFITKENWKCYLWFIIGINLARRAGDTSHFTFKHFYHEDGTYREKVLEFKEEKTDKLSNPYINSSVRNALNVFCERMEINPLEHYTEPLFLNRTGTHPTKVMSVDHYGRMLKKAASEVGIKYNVNTHSTRKYFGQMMLELHPNDKRAIYWLQRLFHHSKEETTTNYLGIDDEMEKMYFDDMGEFCDNYVTGNRKYRKKSKAGLVTLEENDLRDLISIIYKKGIDNANDTNPDTHLTVINEILSMIDTFKK